MTLAVPNNTATATAPAGFARFLDSIKINAVSHRRHHDKTLVLKHRTWFSRRIANLANFYFSMANIPIRFSTHAHEWLARETLSFCILNPGYTAYAEGNATLAAQKLPGKNLFDHLKEKTLTRKMLVAAGQEYRKAHHTRVDGRGAHFWSHGDATMSNVLFDPKTGRARLIDFELHHIDSLPVNQRRADDLLVFLLDLVGYTSHTRWLPMAKAFLEAYGEDEVIAELIPMLKTPRGLARIWFSVRTNFVDPLKVSYRLKQLREYLSHRGTPMRTKLSTDFKINTDF